MTHGVCIIIWDGQLGPGVPEWGCRDQYCWPLVDLSTHHHALSLAGRVALAGPITRWHGILSVFSEHAGAHKRKTQPKNGGRWKKLSLSTSKNKMGGVDVNAIVVDVDHPSPMALPLRTSYKTNGGGRFLVGEQGATFTLYLVLL